MNPESLTVALRPRSAWEAIELGFALARRHAGAVWKPWLLVSVPVLVLLNALAWSLDVIWVAGLLMWWLKPAFDRLPLYVLSRAVFGDIPGPLHTLRAQRGWGGQTLLATLTWRRLSPVRSLYLPVDLLEGASGPDAGARRRTLGGAAYGVAGLLTLVCINFEIALLLGAAAGVFILVPSDMLPESLKYAGELLVRAPPWLQLTYNALAWGAVIVIEPFYVAAGFGLYLNRRTELEAWDIELALRRLRSRLGTGAAVVVLVLAVVVAVPRPAVAQERVPVRTPAATPAAPAPAGSVTGERLPLEPMPLKPMPRRSALLQSAPSQSVLPEPTSAKPLPAPTASPNTRVTGDTRALKKDTGTLPRIFRGALADDTSLRNVVARAYADPRVSPRRRIVRWQQKDAASENTGSDDASPLLAAVGRIFALIAEFGAWALFGLLALALLLTAPRWTKWLRRAASAQRAQPAGIEREPIAALEPLPADIPRAARALWDAGDHRDALALLYRASVAAMAARAGVELVPGATEAQCLRASRKLPLAQDRDAFARLVRTWEQAAYAQRLPGQVEFDEHLEVLGRRFGWTP